MEGAAPIIVTAQLPDDVQAWATALRDQHFPPERNHLAAHVTLFHALPPSCEDELRSVLARIAREHAAVPARLSGLMSLGRGTAYAVESRAMLNIRAELADHFHGLLTSQDQHQPRLHITVQNKVTPGKAKLLLAELSAQFSPRDFTIRGLAMHAYLGGPWRQLANYPFRG